MALNAEGLEVDQSMLCDQIFAEGELRLVGAHIGDRLNLSDGRLTNSGTQGDSGSLALNLENARVDGDLGLRFAERPTGGIDLRGARLGALQDSEDTWPRALRLRGCVYGDLEDVDEKSAHLSTLRPGVGPEVRRRERWIRLGLTEERDGYAPQPYTQLMAFYRQEGHDGDAQWVAYQRERRRHGQLGWPGKASNVFLRWTVGYGYRTWRAALWLVGFVLAGWGVFALAWPERMKALKPEEQLPDFHAWLYSLDTVLPVIKLGQEDSWTPTGAPLAWYALSVLAGWVLITAALAALTAAAVRR